MWVASFQHDEDYFVCSLIPFGRGSYAGDALRKKILDDCRHQQQRVLLRQVVGEFERNPGGLILPPGKVVKGFDVARVLRVAWKIVRGLYFAEFGACLPENCPKNLDIILPGEGPPDSFLALAANHSRGAYPGVFDYTVADYRHFHGLNYWAMLLWDRVILTVTFQAPSCGCPECIAAPA